MTFRGPAATEGRAVASTRTVTTTGQEDDMGRGPTVGGTRSAPSARLGRSTSSAPALGRATRRGPSAAVAAVAVGLTLTVGPALATPPSAEARSVSTVPLHAEYPADLLPIPDAMELRFARMCVALDRVHGFEGAITPELRGYDEAPVRAYHSVGVNTDLSQEAVLAAFLPYLDEVIEEYPSTSQLYGGIGELILHLYLMEGAANITVHLPPQQALTAQAAMPAFPDERSDLPTVDTLRAYETCYGYFDSYGGSLGFLRSHEGAQLTGQELVDQLTALRGDAEGFEAGVSDDGVTGGAQWTDGDHLVLVTLDGYERINEGVYLPLAAMGNAEEEMPVGADGQELERDQDADEAVAGGSDAGVAGAGTEVEDDALGAAAEGGGRGLMVWIAVGILAAAAVAGGMAVGRSRRGTGGTLSKEPASVGAAAPTTKAAPPATRPQPPATRPQPPAAKPTPPKAKPEPPAAKPAPPPPPRAGGGPVPPPMPDPRQERPPEG